MTDEEIAKYSEKCPICKTEWSTVARIVHGGHWVHCVPCKRKADQILKEEEEKNKSSGTKNWDFGGWGGM